mgnify:CR=1 FL=1
MKSSLSIPIQQIYIDRCNEAIEIPEKDDRLDDLYQQGITLVEAVMKFGKPKEEAIEYVMTSEPFCTKSELKRNVEQLLHRKIWEMNSYKVF